MSKKHYLKGVAGEKMAFRYLTKKGYKILKTNYHSRNGEIDIIALDKDILAFVEVKYYSTNNYFHPLQAVNYKKIQHIIKSAKKYYYTNKIKKQCRYDVLTIENDDKGGQEYTLIKDAFRESR